MSQTVAIKRYRDHLSYPSLLLGVAVLLASSLLGLGNTYTADAIAARQAEDLQASLGQVIAPSLYDNDLLSSVLSVQTENGEVLSVYRASRDGAFTAFAFEVVAPDGYGGPIRLLVGVDLQGTLLGVRVLSHAETPGLGDKIDITRSVWVRSFDGLSLQFPAPGAWTVKKNGGHFDQFTGATITPRAVVNAVKGGLEWFERQREVLLAPAIPQVQQAGPISLQGGDHE